MQTARLMIAGWTALLTSAAMMGCSDDDEPASGALTERQQKNVDACHAMQDALVAASCDNAYTIVDCDTYEGISGNCEPYFQCLEAAAAECDPTVMGDCDDVAGDCGMPR